MTVEQCDAQFRNEQGLHGKDVTLRHYDSKDVIAKEWAPWAIKEGVKRLITANGLELWPNMDARLEANEDGDGCSDK